VRDVGAFFRVGRFATLGRPRKAVTGQLLKSVVAYKHGELMPEFDKIGVARVRFVRWAGCLNHHVKT
jgi:hypothetical protein